MDKQAPHRALTELVLAAAFKVHTQLGPGLLESTYQACLAYELTKRGLRVELQVPVPAVYDGQKLLDVGYRMDILVNDTVVSNSRRLRRLLPFTVHSCCPTCGTLVGGWVCSSTSMSCDCGTGSFGR